jgi:hypothetical protein
VSKRAKTSEHTHTHMASTTNVFEDKPALCEIQGKVYFTCQWTGEPLTKRFGLYSRKQKLRGCFGAPSLVIAALKEKAEQNIISLQTYLSCIKNISDASEPPIEVLPLPAAPHRSQLALFGGPMKLEEFKNTYAHDLQVKTCAGGQTIEEYLQTQEDARRKRHTIKTPPTPPPPPPPQSGSNKRVKALKPTATPPPPTKKRATTKSPPEPVQEDSEHDTAPEGDDVAVIVPTPSPEPEAPRLYAHVIPPLGAPIHTESFLPQHIYTERFWDWFETQMGTKNTRTIAANKGTIHAQLFRGAEEKENPYAALLFSKLSVEDVEPFNTIIFLSHEKSLNNIIPPETISPQLAATLLTQDQGQNAGNTSQTATSQAPLTESSANVPSEPQLPTLSTQNVGGPIDFSTLLPTTADVAPAPGKGVKTRAQKTDSPVGKSKKSKQRHV